jgi:hypothetical protein
MLATLKPKSLISNSVINLEDTLLRCNRNEFHHIFPKAYLSKISDENKKRAKEDLEGYAKNWLINFCFLSSADNQRIKDKAPKSYVELIPEENREDAFKNALLPNGWFDKSFEDFCEERYNLFVSHAQILCGDQATTAT